VHLVASIVVATLVGLLVFSLWYPYPYRELSGGRELFQLVVMVDVVLGPALTFVAFNRAKPRAELRRDLAAIVVLQLAGLAYGLWTVQLARPVHMVFEYDRLRVVHRSEIPSDLESLAPPGIPVAPVTGPTLIALRPFRDSKEEFEFTTAALGGVQLSARPELWQEYAVGRPRVLQAARPAAQLVQRFPARADEIAAILRGAGRDAAAVAYLPVVGRNAEAWTALLDAGSAEVIGYLPLDSF
jgi:hypothetical protein